MTRYAAERDVMDDCKGCVCSADLRRENAAVYGLLADIRAAVGDPTGKLMQDELVAHCRALRLTDAEREAIKEACDEGRWYPKDYHHIHTMRALLERTTL